MADIVIHKGIREVITYSPKDKEIIRTSTGEPITELERRKLSGDQCSLQCDDRRIHIIHDDDTVSVKVTRPGSVRNLVKCNSFNAKDGGRVGKIDQKKFRQLEREKSQLKISTQGDGEVSWLRERKTLAISQTNENERYKPFLALLLALKQSTVSKTDYLNALSLLLFQDTVELNKTYLALLELITRLQPELVSSLVSSDSPASLSKHEARSHINTLIYREMESCNTENDRECPVVPKSQVWKQSLTTTSKSANKTVSIEELKEWSMLLKKLCLPRGCETLRSEHECDRLLAFVNELDNRKYLRNLEKSPLRYRILVMLSKSFRVDIDSLSTLKRDLEKRKTEVRQQRNDLLEKYTSTKNLDKDESRIKRLEKKHYHTVVTILRHASRSKLNRYSTSKILNWSHQFFSYMATVGVNYSNEYNGYSDNGVLSENPLYNDVSLCEAILAIAKSEHYSKLPGVTQALIIQYLWKFNQLNPNKLTKKITIFLSEQPKRLCREIDEIDRTVLLLWSSYGFKVSIDKFHDEIRDSELLTDVILLDKTLSECESPDFLIMYFFSMMDEGIKEQECLSLLLYASSHEDIWDTLNPYTQTLIFLKLLSRMPTIVSADKNLANKDGHYNGVSEFLMRFSAEEPIDTFELMVSDGFERAQLKILFNFYTTGKASADMLYAACHVLCKDNLRKSLLSDIKRAGNKFGSAHQLMGRLMTVHPELACLLAYDKSIRNEFGYMTADLYEMAKDEKHEDLAFMLLNSGMLSSRNPSLFSPNCNTIIFELASVHIRFATELINQNRLSEAKIHALVFNFATCDLSDPCYQDFLIALFNTNNVDLSDNLSLGLSSDSAGAKLEDFQFYDLYNKILEYLSREGDDSFACRLDATENFPEDHRTKLSTTSTYA